MTKEEVKQENWVEKIRPYEVEVKELITNYNSLVVTQETIDEAELALKKIAGKRFELQNQRKMGTSWFENVKKQFQSYTDKLVDQIVPVENRIKSELNRFKDDAAWAKAQKKNSIEAYSLYLKIFDSPEFEYKGQFINAARAAIDTIERTERNQINNYTDFQRRCNLIHNYRTSSEASEGLKRLKGFEITDNDFGFNKPNAIAIKQATIEMLEKFVVELSAREAEQQRLDEERKIEREKLEQQRKEMEEEQRKVREEQERIRLEAEAQYKQMREEQEQMLKENERLKAEAMRIAQENLEREKQARAEAEMKTAELIREQHRIVLEKRGLVEIDGETFNILQLEDLKSYFRDTFDASTKEKIKNMMSEAHDGITEGKKFYNDLTDKQRINIEIRESYMTNIQIVTDKLFDDFTLAEHINEGILTIQEVVNRFHEVVLYRVIENSKKPQK